MNKRCRYWKCFKKTVPWFTIPESVCCIVIYALCITRREDNLVCGYFGYGPAREQGEPGRIEYSVLPQLSDEARVVEGLPACHVTCLKRTLEDRPHEVMYYGCPHGEDVPTLLVNSTEERSLRGQWGKLVEILRE